MVPAVGGVKPKLRGVFHELGFYAAIVLGVPLVWTAEDGRARLAAVVFVGCLAGCFGASALYHRPTWTPRVRAWLDHAGVYLLIAGTYVPFGLLVMSPGWAAPVLSVVWSGALAAIVLKLFWVRAPKWLSAAIGLLLGWVGAVAFSQLLKLEVVGVLLVVAGGLLYSAGRLSMHGDVQTLRRTCSATTSCSTCSRSAPPAASSPRSRSTSSLAADRDAATRNRVRSHSLRDRRRPPPGPASHDVCQRQDARRSSNKARHPRAGRCG